MSMFMPDATGGSASPPQQKQSEGARPKRPRSSLACIRCRKKKVKCDFVQPTCGRCSVAGLPCSYATPPRRVDGQAFDQLGSHVEELKERMQKMQSELALMKTNLRPFPESSGTNSNDEDHGNRIPSAMLQNQALSLESVDGGPMALMEYNEAQQGEQQSVTWKISLSPSGLRIDTNIASVTDLYHILLHGISRLNINNDSATNLFSTDSLRVDGTGKHTRNKSWDKASPNHLDIGPSSSSMDTFTQPPQSMSSSSSGNGSRLWEVSDSEARKIMQERTASGNTLPPEKLHYLMHNCYHKCFLAYQIADPDEFLNQYANPQGAEPLLTNSINAWMSKHGCIYHNICPEADPISMGEVYFQSARQQLKKCFDISSPTTIHALLNLYMYQLSSERSSLAYLYIGLAIRMAQDLKLHKKEYMPADTKQREMNKRLWWSAYWLDLCAALESNRPTMVDDKDCDLEFPTRLDHEDDETGYRISFCVHSIKLMQIRKDIAKNLPSEQCGQSLLSAISRLENALTNWLNELPPDLRFEPEDTFHPTGSFRDEACMILNIQYQTTWIMLHKFFLPKPDQTATPVALLSLNICTKSANFIAKMLDIYAKNLAWCQFTSSLDGVIASVAIHQMTAQSSEKEVALLAQRNLIVTANVLRQSPLLYMEKVNDIIDSIDAFLTKNDMPTDLANLPPVNEESFKQQSISSVFHPTSFESPSLKTSTLSHSTHSPSQPSQSLPQQQVQPPAQPAQRTLSPFANSTRSTPGTQSVKSHLTNMGSQSNVSSPMPQMMQSTPVTAPSVASQMPVSFAGQGQSPIPMVPTSLQGAMSQPHQPPPPSAQQRPFEEPLHNTLLFSNQPMMDFNLQAGADSNMDQLLFRDSSFGMNENAGAGGFDAYSQMTNNILGSSGFSSHPFGSGTPTNASNSVFPFTSMYPGSANEAVPADTTSYPQSMLGHPGLFGFTGLAGLPQRPFVPMQNQSSQTPTQLTADKPTQAQQANGLQPTSTNAQDMPGIFDPVAFFPPGDFMYAGGDPTVAAVASNANLFSSSPFGNFGQPTSSQVPMSFGSQSELYSSMSAAATQPTGVSAEAAGRKRTHRDWEDAA